METMHLKQRCSFEQTAFSSSKRRSATTDRTQQTTQQTEQHTLNHTTRTKQAQPTGPSDFRKSPTNTVKSL